MLGTFLEFGFAARPVGEAFEFYRSIGFQAVPVGDILDYPYAVVTDGDICIGLHEGEHEGTLLTFVRPDLKDYLRALRRAHIELEFSRLAADEFNEAGFRDPNTQLVTLLEARTFSPGSWELPPPVPRSPPWRPSRSAQLPASSSCLVSYYSTGCK